MHKINYYFHFKSKNILELKMLYIERVVSYTKQSISLNSTKRNLLQRVLSIFGLSFLLLNLSPTKVNHTCEDRNCITNQLNLHSTERSSFNGQGNVRNTNNGEVLEAKTAEYIDNGKLDLQVVSQTKKTKTNLRTSKEFCNKLMYEIADFVGSSKITGCSAQCRSACGNMWDINSKDGDRCERQCRLCWNVLEYEPNDCKSVNTYPMVLPDKI